MKRSQRQYLVDMFEAMQNAEGFIADMTLHELTDDTKTQLALQRCFSIIGEAANKVDASVKEQYPEIPWRQMVGMRNVMVHGYWNVKLDVVWDTIRNRFDREIRHLRKVIDELPSEDDLINPS